MIFDDDNGNDISSKGQRAAAFGAKHRVFDWDKAVQLIKEHSITECDAGLSSDLNWTSGVILSDGKPVLDSYAYLSSNWATPVLVLPDGEELPCWTYSADSEYTSDTNWPKSALEALTTNTTEE